MDMIGQNHAPAEPWSPFRFRAGLDVTEKGKSLSLAGILTSNRPVRSLFAIPSTALEKGEGVQSAPETCRVILQYKKNTV
jgi:hypothetical protein